MPGRLHLRDISSKGQLLVGQGIARRGIVVSSNHGESLRDLSWLDFSYLRDISDDGKMILFEEEGSSTSNYTVYVRDTDGSSAVPIGEGYAGALSRDKKWALAIKLTEPNHEIWLLPIGPGEPRRVNPPNLRFQRISFPSSCPTASGSFTPRSSPANVFLEFGCRT